MHSYSLFSTSLHIGAQVASSNASIFPDTPKCQLVREYVDAFNAGESEIREFWEKISPSDIPTEQRLERYRRIKSDIGNIVPLSILRDTPEGLDVLVQTAKGEKLRLVFLVTDDPKPRLRGLQIEENDERALPEPQLPPRAESTVLSDIKKRVEVKSKADEFSGTILIARGSDILWEGAYGMADENFKIPNQVNTRFDNGSITKSFTRVAIGQLIEEGIRVQV